MGFERFLVVSDVLELHRKLREACRKNSRYILSKSELVVPSYMPLKGLASKSNCKDFDRTSVRKIDRNLSGKTPLMPPTKNGNSL